MAGTDVVRQQSSRRCQSRTATGRPKRPVLPLHYILDNMEGIHTAPIT